MAIMRRPLFANATDEGSGSLGHLVAVYIERHHTLWKVSIVFRRLLLSGHLLLDIACAKRHACISSLREAEITTCL